MTMDWAIGLTVAWLVMTVGVLGCFIPGIPATPVIFLTALGHRIYFGDAGPSTWVLVVLGALMAVSTLMDFLATLYGAKFFGATRRGIWGAAIGGLVGLFFSLPGLIIGPFLGAIVFEMVGGRRFIESTKAGLGAIIGLIAGAVGKLVFCLVMVALFSINVLGKSFFRFNPANSSASAVQCCQLYGADFCADQYPYLRARHPAILSAWADKFGRYRASFTPCPARRDCRKLAPRLVAHPRELRVGMKVGGQAFVSFALVNVGLTSVLSGQSGVLDLGLEAAPDLVQVDFEIEAADSHLDNLRLVAASDEARLWTRGPSGKPYRMRSFPARSARFNNLPAPGSLASEC